MREVSEMSQNQPLVSFVIPVFNVERFVGLAIQSALDQTYQNIEIVIVNDGSTDSSESEILKFKDSRIRYIKQVNQGPSGCINRGIRESRGEYIALLSGDDVARSHRVQTSLDQLRAANASFFFGGVQFISERGVQMSDAGWAHESFPSLALSQSALLSRLFSHGNFLNASTFFCKKQALPLELFHPALLQLQDYDLWIRLAASSEFFVSKECVTLYRVLSGGGNLSRPNRYVDVRTQNEMTCVFSRFFAAMSDRVFEHAFGESFRFLPNVAGYSRIGEEILLLLKRKHPGSLLVAFQRITDLITRSSFEESAAEIVRQYGFDSSLTRALENEFSVAEGPRERLPQTFTGTVYPGSVAKEQSCFHFHYKIDSGGRFSWDIPLESRRYSGVLRFDPWEGFFGKLEMTSLSLCSRDGSIRESLTFDRLANNSVYVNAGEIYFGNLDPWVWIKSPQLATDDNGCRIVGTGRILPVEDSDVRILAGQMLVGKSASILQKAKQLIRKKRSS